jgi:hypothetical protein
MSNATISPSVSHATVGNTPARLHREPSGRLASRGGRRFAVITSWLPLVVLPVVAATGSRGAPGWLQMLAVSISLLAGLKWLSWRAAVRRGSECGWGRSIGYLLAWPGMDARTFLDSRRVAARPSGREWLLASAKFLLGAVLVWGTGLVWGAARMALPLSGVVTGWIAVAGFLAMIHFGAFDLLSLAWRTFGVEAAPIMQRPFAARTLSEFWGQRWNLAFRQVAFDCVYRPLIRPLGARPALAVVFAFSAALHELAISLPAHAGYGLPSLYFLLQAAGVVAARSPWGRRMGIDRGRGARVFAWLMVLGLAPLLFHPPFLARVMVPLLAAVGAL